MASSSAAALAVRGRRYLPCVSEILTGAAVVGAVFTLLSAVRVGARALRNTVGRRWANYSKLGRVAVTAQLGYFVAVLGEPAVKRQNESGTTTALFVDPDFFLQAVVGADGLVISYSVTTRSPRFRPKLWWPTTGDGFQGVTLGRSTFVEAGDPTQVTGSRGARRIGYAEIHYFGNPGHYQEFALSYNDSGAGDLVDFTDVFASDGPLDSLAAGALALETYLRDAQVHTFRFRSVPNTYSVSAPFAQLDSQEWGLGVDLDQVRPFFLVEQRPWWQRILN